MDNSIYQDIAKRTQGDIYIGVVGPVRTGKSTFIKRFMEALVVPNIENGFIKDRTIDELPQSGAGKMIMTTEPKFVPNEAVRIDMGDNSYFNVRLIDCVGYIVPNALGYIENDIPRMVRTPWFENEVPFEMAAEVGTKKVINEHSTIGFVITTDGSIGEIERDDYIDAEERVINELKEINKPFVVIVNTKYPTSEKATSLVKKLAERYKVPVTAVNCMELDENKIKELMGLILYEFPISEININLPKWICALDEDYWLKKSLYGAICETASNIEKIRELKSAAAWLENNEYVTAANIDEIDMGTGSAVLNITTQPNLFYTVLKETSGMDINDEGQLISAFNALAKAKKNYDKFEYALNEANLKGYGIVTPTIDELRLEQPQIVHQGGKYGVKLKASAPSIHMIRADIETEVSPLVGSEKQSEELVKFLLDEFEESPDKIWESNIFGKSLHELVNEGLQNKLYRMPEDARDKMQETLQRIINEGSGGLICIIL